MAKDLVEMHVVLLFSFELCCMQTYTQLMPHGFSELAIFFWIMHLCFWTVFHRWRSVTNLLFSFELCMRNAYGYHDGLIAEFCLLFSFELCWQSRSQRGNRITWVLLAIFFWIMPWRRRVAPWTPPFCCCPCYFLLNYASRVHTIIHGLSIPSSLLFSFELCPSRCQTPCYPPPRTRHASCYFLLNYAPTASTTSLAMPCPTCYFLLNYAARL